MGVKRVVEEQVSVDFGRAIWFPVDSGGSDLCSICSQGAGASIMLLAYDVAFGLRVPPCKTATLILSALIRQHVKTPSLTYIPFAVPLTLPLFDGTLCDGCCECSAFSRLKANSLRKSLPGNCHHPHMPPLPCVVVLFFRR